MPIDQLIFVGLNGYVVALHRDTGEIIWANKELSGMYVTLILDDDHLMVSSSGYIYCLDPQTGKILWHNPMKGFGVGTPTALVSARSQVNVSQIEQQVALIQAAAVAASK